MSSPIFSCFVNTTYIQHFIDYAVAALTMKIRGQDKVKYSIMRNSPPFLAFAETYTITLMLLEIEPNSLGVFPPHHGAWQIIH